MLLRRLRKFATVSYTESLYTNLQAEEHIFQKNLRFLKFCDQMSKLNKQQEENQNAALIRNYNLKFAALASTEPMREILNHYMNHRTDYSVELITESFEYLGNVAAELQGKFPEKDMTLSELHESWQFTQLLNDFKLAINGQEYMPPLQMSKCVLALAKLQYKDSDFFQKIIQAFKSSDRFGTSARDVYPDHIYSGFIQNDEFKNHLATLLEWKAPRKFPTRTRLESDVADLVDEAEDVKMMQKDMASAVLNVSAHYFSLVEMQRTHEDLKENPEIALELFELQESLVKAKLLDPYDLDEESNFIDMDKMMKRAERTFSDIISTSFNYLKSPAIDAVYEAGTQFNGRAIPDVKTSSIPNPNKLTALMYGKFFSSVAEAMHIDRRDLNGNDYPNEIWRDRAELNRDQYDENVLLIEKYYSNI